MFLWNTPCKISKPENIKITGHNLNGKKSILKPVNIDNTDIASNITNESIYTDFTMRLLLLLRRVTIITSNPTKIKVKLSLIHSMVIIRILSVLISPNPFTTEAVGNKCAIPQRIVTKPPIWICICLYFSFFFFLGYSTLSVSDLNWFKSYPFGIGLPVFVKTTLIKFSKYCFKFSGEES